MSVHCSIGKKDYTFFARQINWKYNGYNKNKLNVLGEFDWKFKLLGKTSKENYHNRNSML